MAGPVSRGLTDSEARILREVVNTVRSRGYDLGRPGQRPPVSGLRRAKVITSAIAAGAAGAFEFCDSSWTATGEPNAEGVANDHLIELPVATPCYLGLVDGAWAVVVPFVNCPEE